MIRTTLLFWAALLPGAGRNALVYEGIGLPEQDGWERVQYLECDRILEGGCLLQQCDLGGSPGPIGETDLYRRSLAEFVGEEAFFIEWRVQTDVPSDLFDRSGIATAISASGTSGTNYHCTLTDDLVRLLRDNFLPIVYAEVGPDAAHIYRLELFGTERYTWYVDGVVVAAGSPEGPYPLSDSSLIWGARHNVYDNLSSWDFVRAGVIPMDASGDYDSDGAETLFDLYFFDDCLTKDGPGILGGPGNDAGPGCRFADFDSDADVDLLDFAEFQNLFSGP